MKAPLNDLRDTAIRAAHASGRLLMKHFGKKLKISEKAKNSLVTNADIEAEEASVRILTRAYPDFGFITEEAPPRETDGRGRWIIDPLDGTTNFIHGFPMFCVSIAAEWQGELTVGVIYHPVLRDTYVAVRGKGATINGKKMRVTSNTRLEDCLVSTGFAYRIEGNELDLFGRVSSQVRAVRRPGSAALDLAYVARGVFDGFWEQRLSPWDVAAGALLVSEAGGRVTDYTGGKFDIFGRQILATNGRVHGPMQKLVQDATGR